MAQPVCMPVRFATMCSKLTPDQRCAVEEVGFDSLLCIPAMPIQRFMLQVIFESYNTEECSFGMHGHLVPMSTWDVYCILGLVDKGENIVISKKKQDTKWFNLFRGKGDTAITFKHLESEIASGVAGDHFKRMFVLYTMGTILAPSSKGYVNSEFINIVKDVSKIRDFNWARFTLDYLKEHLALFKKNQRNGLVGNLAFLQAWFFEHFRVDGDYFQYELHERPLIKNWSKTKVKKRALLEGIAQVKVHIRLELSGFKGCADSDHLDEGINCDFSRNVACGDNDENEEINIGGSHDAEKGDESHTKTGTEDTNTKDSPDAERLGSLFSTLKEGHQILDERVGVIEDRTRCLPEVLKLLQRISAQLDSSPKSTTCEEKHGHKKDDKKNNAKVKAEPGDVMHENDKKSTMGNSGKSSKKPVTDPDQSDVFGVKRKIDFASSPTLVQNVKGRRNRQPSKVCQSPYECIKRKRIFGTKSDGDKIDNIIEGLDLSPVELAAIKYIRKELALDERKVLVRIGPYELSGFSLRCLIRPVRENGIDKWLDSEVISSYAAMFNMVWAREPKQMKFAISDYHSQWLRAIGKDWIKTSKLCRRVSPGMHELCQNFVTSDLVFIPMNTSNSHWWLCVLCPAKKQIQIIDSMDRQIDYASETRELRCGIHSILQANLSAPMKLESRWSNYDVLSWNVVVIDNIRRQRDVCSCGIFTIKHMQYWNGSTMTSSFSHDDMETFRKKMLAELIFSPTNELSSTKDDVLAMVNS